MRLNEDNASFPEWRNRPERSNVFAIRLIVWIARTLGRRAARFLLYPITAYFVASAPNTRAASKQYLNKVLGRKAGLRDVFRHCHVFASTILDRVFMLDNRFDLLDVRLHGIEVVQQVVAQGTGCVLFGAHLGSFEVVRMLAREKFSPPACMVMYGDNAKKISSVLHSINPELTQRIIELSQPDSMLKVSEALQRGEFIGILADRVVAGEGEAQCEFLGAPAKFPTGPFRMARLLQAPAMLMVGLYRGGNVYDVYFELLPEPPADLPRKVALEQFVRDYVTRIEQYCRVAPYNWFNFFDFWS
jgi:predicted LPLAT superfamily acyltransferase